MKNLFNAQNQQQQQQGKYKVVTQNSQGPFQMKFQGADKNDILLKCLDNGNTLRLQNIMNERWISLLTNPMNQITFLKNNIIVNGQNGKR